MATAATGTAYGVHGRVSSASGYAGYFEGGHNYFEGRVGIGTSAPTETLEVNGNIRVANNADILGLDRLVGSSSLNLYGDAAGGPDLTIALDGRIGQRQAYSSVTFNIRGQAPEKQLLNVKLSNGDNIFMVRADRVVVVTGDFFVNNGSKNLRIDDPLDPDNRSLVHNAVEEPGMYTFYRGNVVLDAHGEAWVEMPAYFDTLNTEPTYPLICVGGYAPVYVAEEICDNRLKIAGGREGLKVSWQVSGVRNEAYARDHPYQDVVEKEGSERGRYYYPAGQGMPEEMGTNYSVSAGAGEGSATKDEQRVDSAAARP